MPVTRLQDFNGFIDPVRAEPIFERTARNSVMQQLCPRHPLGLTATVIPVMTGRPTAAWVAEGARKPTTTGQLALKNMKPNKIATIFPFSAEVARANPGNFVNVVREAMAEAFAVGFDRAALHGQGPDGTPAGGPFTSFLDQTTKEVTFGTTASDEGGVRGDLVAVLAALRADTNDQGDKYRLTGWAFDDDAEPLLLGAVDTLGRPLFNDAASDVSTVTGGTILRRRAFMGEGVGTGDTLGFAGDFSKTAWGTLGGITYDVSTQATITIDGALVSTWENNLVAVRAEAEYGFLVADPEAFVRLVSS